MIGTSVRILYMYVYTHKDMYKYGKNIEKKRCRECYILQMNKKITQWDCLEHAKYSTSALCQYNF